MSGKLHIQFANDMPGASVEVITPTLETVGRVWVDQGGSAAIDVPSEESFLRVHLPSGQVVTVLEGRGQLNRQISLANLQQPTERRALPDRPSTSAKSTKKMRDVRSLYQFRTQSAIEQGLRQFTPDLETTVPQLHDGTKAQLAWAGGQPMHGSVDLLGEEIRFAQVQRTEPCELNLTGPGGQLRVQLPGMLKTVYVRADELEDGLRVVNVRVATLSEKADYLMAYLTRGDLYSAESLTSWADSAEQMLYEKMSDPFAAMVGAYLLLKLRRFDLMRSWVRNLADGWPDLTDGNVIWAWQLIHQREPNQEAEIRERLEKAAAAGLPIFSEGLSLLRDGLHLLGPKSKEPLEQLNQRAGILVYDSPFTAGLHDRPSTSGARTQFSVGYLPPA